MKVLKKIGTIAASVILWLIILLAALFAFTTLATRDDKSVASIAGFTPMIVQSPSMKPTFNQGDLIFIQKCDTSKLKVDDVVTFHTIIQNEYALNTHRIIKVEEMNGVRYFTTKGDNNDIADASVIVESDIVGKYVAHLPWMGNVMTFLSSSVGFLLVIVLPMLAFFIYQIYHLITVSMRLKRAMAEENAAAGAADADAARAEAEAARAEAAAMKEELERLRANAGAAKEEKAEKSEQEEQE